MAESIIKHNYSSFMTDDATATAVNILSGKIAYGNSGKITGTMTNNGAKTSSLNCGGSYTIPAGYHNGSGKITANSLASQTSATAAAAQILSGYTAWVNGSKITGTASTGYTTVSSYTDYLSGGAVYGGYISTCDLASDGTLKISYNIQATASTSSISIAHLTTHLS
jgi:hypothetical protein